MPHPRPSACLGQQRLDDSDMAMGRLLSGIGEGRFRGRQRRGGSALERKVDARRDHAGCRCRMAEVLGRNLQTAFSRGDRSARPDVPGCRRDFLRGARARHRGALRLAGRFLGRRERKRNGLRQIRQKGRARQGVRRELVRADAGRLRLQGVCMGREVPSEDGMAQPERLQHGRRVLPSGEGSRRPRRAH